MFRFEISKLDWEVIKLPNPYLYTEDFSENLYQEIDQNYDLINLGPAIISLQKPWHVEFNFISEKQYADDLVFDKKNEVFIEFNKIISDIGKLLCRCD
ncbi:hypothetical protein [Xylocopilactobacillus apis]|uniref:hypothetical protein n=1 Tax=Xylocopilactobacillus apis TaxID=2932183 RepID=UPI002954DDD9|nr:hypothetical protein [Xylocopilactobacillus apis]